MKILKLSLKNINALQGEWHIDLGERGLFAIVGDTGAGKTTILDAICLALYGRTPRLKTISANQNELMHKGSGEMVAEVMVLVADKRYLFRFFQRRARGRTDGNLQTIEHTISYEKEGAFYPYVLAKTAVEKKTQAILGMDFEQFTRSVLLAQGDFAQFLHSDATSRGAMLENITGSSIYRHIGIYIYNEHKAQEGKLKQWQNALTALSGQNSTQSLDDITKALTLAKDESQKNQATLQDLKGKHQAIIDYQSHLQQQKTLNKQRLDAKDALDDFADDKKRLERHQRGAWVNADFIAWQTNRQAIDRLLEQINDHQTKQQNLTADITDNKKQLTDTKERLATQEQYADNTLPQLTKALEIDQNLSRHQNNLDHYQKNQEELKEEIRQAKDKCTQLKDELTALDTTLRKQQDLLNDRTQQTINTKLESIIAQCTLINDTREDYHLSLEKLQKIQETLDNLQKCRIATLHEITVLKDEQDKNQDAFNNSKQAFLSLCQSGDYISTYQQGQQRLTALKDLERKAQQYQQKQIQLDEQTQSLKVLQNQLDEQSRRQQNAQNAFDTATHHHTLAKENIFLRQRLAQLQDNHPCPLCGSLDHPYKAQAQPFYDDLSPIIAQLGETRQALDDENVKTQALQENIRQQKWQIDGRQKELHQDWQTLSYQWTALTGTYLPSTADTKQLSTDISSLVLEQGGWLDGLTQSHSNYTNAKNALENHSGELQRLEYNSQADQNTTDNETKNQICHQQILAKQKSTLDNAYAHLKNSPIPVSVLPTTCPWQTNDKIPDDYLNTLRTFCKQAKNNKTGYDNTLKANIKTQSEQKSKALALAEQEKHLTALKEKADTITKKITSTEQEIKCLVQDRRKLIGDDQNPQQAIDDIKNKIGELKVQLASDHSKQSELEQQQKELSQTLAQAKDERQKLEDNTKQLKQNLDNALAKQQFIDIDDYLSAQLAPDVADALGKQYNALLDDEKNPTIALGLLQKDIETLMIRYSDLDRLTLTPIEADIAQAKTAQQALDETIATLAAEQKIITTQQQKAKELTNTIAQHQKALAPLRLLNDLIGSADGKKFSHHIQELHLAKLLAYANHQLQAMGDRYTLIPSPDDKNKLGIDIIDHYQQCTRTSHNLSGGEQFIVSLALALGLSQFSSQNNPIDSLFLDEGFGTLDDKHLAQALATLSELQLSGKTIGVISHMPSLKEQIDDQISVQKIGGGQSKISGTGVVAIG